MERFIRRIALDTQWMLSKYESSPNFRTKTHTETKEGMNEGKKIMERLLSLPGPESQKGQGERCWPFPEVRRVTVPRALLQIWASSQSLSGGRMRALLL